MSSVFQDRGIGNTSLSTFGVAQAALEIILMLYPFSDPPTPTHFLSVAEVACSMAKSNIVKPALFTQDIVQPDIFRKTRCAVSSPFYFSWKGAELRCLRRWLKQLFYQLRSVFGPWLICWTATWWYRLSLASTACEALRFSLPGRMTQPWQR